MHMDGEGYKTFNRLREEILKETNNMSIFTWISKFTSTTYCGIPATNSADFATCESVSNFSASLVPGTEIVSVNSGMKVQALLSLNPNDEYVMILVVSYLPLLLNKSLKIGALPLNESILLDVPVLVTSWD